MFSTSREVEVARGHRQFLTVVLFLLIFMSGVFISSHAAELEYSPQTKPAPLKGLINDLDTNDTMEWRYLSLNKVMTGPNTFDWDRLEKMLDRSNKQRRTLIIRPILDNYSIYPATPSYLTNYPGATISIQKQYQYLFYPRGGIVPVYTNANVMSAMLDFIKAFGEKYDGDPRIAFIEVGLLGHWGEWYGLNLKAYPHTLAPMELKRQILEAYQQYFKKTKVMMRLPVKELIDIPTGYHDDAFNFWKQQDLLYRKQTNAGPEAVLRWRTCPIGARLHPELDDEGKIKSMPPEFASTTNLLHLIKRDHISWIRLWRKSEVASLELLGNLRECSSKMGYELYISHVESKNNETLQLSVTITNTGVAPFYYPWQVEVGLWRDKKLQQTWPVDWDITKVIPGENSVTYQATLKGLTKKAQVGNILLRVVNPLEKGFVFRFANKTQDADLDGWVTLINLANN